MPGVLIVGGGISGLAVAWFLREARSEVTVLEAGPEPGGSIRTLESHGFRVDAGPTSTLYRDGALGHLVRGLGLEGELIEASPAAKRRYIAKDHRLIALPAGPIAFLTTPLFTPRGKLRLLLEPLRGRAREEESIAQFVRRRLGPEFLDWAIDPFVSGVYAGDPERLSVRSATAKIYALEAEHRSIFLGALARMVRGRPSGPQPTGRLVSFRAGMQALPRAIARDLGPRFVAGADVTAIEREPQGWRAHTARGSHAAETLVLAVPAYGAAALLAPLAPQAVAALQEIPYPAVASVALGFVRAAVGHALDGFGLLIPSRLGRRTLGALFSSTLFPERAPAGHVLLTAFIGGARDPVRDVEPGALVARVLADLCDLLDLRGPPVYERVTLWPHAIPQYTLGHGARLARVDAELAGLPGLHLRANWRDGVSLSDCAENGRRLAASLTRQ